MVPDEMPVDSRKATYPGDPGEAGGTMKITIEPTDPANLEQNSVTVGHVDDHLNIDQVAELVKAALLGYGFHPDVVQKLFSE